jgi:hypothetical protein
LHTPAQHCGPCRLSNQLVEHHLRSLLIKLYAIDIILLINF